MTAKMTLPEWLLTLEQRHHTAIDMGLSRVRQVAERMGLTRPHGTVITVAGTNGKGSCVRTLETLLRDQGFSTGAYTSPHLLKYNERVRLNALDASDEALVAAFDAVEAARGDIGLSYFEAGTLAAFWLFDQLRVDFWLLEVGLGGRLDAVNILDADIAVVTSIAVDHEAWLGSDRRQIAREKMGVSRPARPLFVAEQDPPEGMREHAELLCTEAYFVGQEFSFQIEGPSLSLSLPARDGSRLTLSGLAIPELPLPSVAAALAVCHWLGLLPQDRRLDKLLSELNLAGRLQRIEAGGRIWLLDVGHNPAAAAYLIQRKALQRVKRLVLGMVHDKDVSATLKVFEPHFDHWYFATPNAHGREANAEELQRLIANTHESQAFASVKDAMQSALDESRHGDTILVAGSFYTVGDALNWLATIS